MVRTAGIVIAAIGVGAILCVAGCVVVNKTEANPGSKESKIIAAENIELKKELEQTKQSLATCQEEKKALEKRAQGNLKGLLDILLKQQDETVRKLREENAGLKAQVEQLKGTAAAEPNKPAPKECNQPAEKAKSETEAR